MYIRHVLSLLPVLAMCALVSAQIKRDVYAYPVNAKPVISIRNQYGRITVSPSSANRVVATVTHTSAVEIHAEQVANRIELATGSQIESGAKADNVDYQVLVPADAYVILSTAAGSLSAENLEGDLVFEGATASVDAHLIRNAHVHIKTLSGPITLREISGGRVEAFTSSGDVSLQDVSGEVEVHSGAGRIQYSGNPGLGVFKLVSATGNIDIAVPSFALARFKARSVKGRIAGPGSVPLARSLGFAPGEGSSLLHNAGAVFDLHSFRGNISVRETSK